MERTLGVGMRLLLGLLGAAALLGGMVVGASESRRLLRGSSAAPAVLVVAVCVLVAWGGVSLLLGAYRGRIRVRQTRARRR